MAFVTGFPGLSGRRLPFGSPYLGLGADPALARAQEAIGTAASGRDEAVRRLKFVQGLAQAIERNKWKLEALLGLEKAEAAVSEAHESVARSRGDYEQAAVELNNARVSAGLTRLEI